jgi:type III secretory pathway component EscU
VDAVQAVLSNRHLAVQTLVEQPGTKLALDDNWPLLARRIIQEAEQHQVPVYEDPDLASLLSMLPLDPEIPPDLYAAVAEVLAFIYTLAIQQRGARPLRRPRS